MMPSETLAHLEIEIRAAVAAGDFAGARAVWDRYAACLRGLPATDPGTSLYLDQTRRLVEWTRQTCTAVRTQAQEQLHQLAGVSRYVGDASPRRHLFQMSG